MSKRGKLPTGGLPTRDDVLGFIADNPKRATKRDIAKAFAVKGEDRPALKALLMELEETGALARQGKRLAAPDALPAVAVIVVTGRDADGALVAEAVRDHEGQDTPIIRLASSGHAGSVPGVGSKLLARLSRTEGPDGRPYYVARAIKHLGTETKRMLGVVSRGKRDDDIIIEPIDRKGTVHRVLANPDLLLNDGELVEFEPVKSRGGRMPAARVTSRLGAVNTEKAVSLIAIHDHGLPHVFGPDVLQEAEDARFDEAITREDWRDIPLVTIDPVDAKDHDDAVHAEPDPSPGNANGHILHVAIADVAAYVRPGSAMDREAVLRGNSAYFPDRVVPMLPERISNDLCSLKEQVDRPALAFRIVIDENGKVLKHSLHRVLMRSVRKLPYETAQAIIDGTVPDDGSGIRGDVLAPLFAAWKALKRARDRRGPIELNLPERKLRLDAEGRVAEVFIPPRLDAHRLIEDFMILANVCAAETLERAQLPLIYRVHAPPSLAKQEMLRDFLMSIDIKIPVASTLDPARLNGILERVAGSEHEDAVNQMVLRSQSQAIYDTENIGHFGLNLLRYAHFTSPIRRYADLTVHRALIRTLKREQIDEPYPDASRLKAIAEDISMTERRAMAAERDTVDRLVAHYLKDRIGAVFPGVISGVARAGLFVSVGDFGADGFVPVATLGDEYFVYDESMQAQIGQQTGTGYRIADAVEVRLRDVDVLTGSVTLEMVSEGRTLAQSTQSRHKRKGMAARRRSGGPPKGIRRSGKGKRR